MTTETRQGTLNAGIVDGKIHIVERISRGVFRSICGVPVKLGELCWLLAAEEDINCPRCKELHSQKVPD